MGLVNAGSCKIAMQFSLAEEFSWSIPKSMKVDVGMFKRKILGSACEKQFPGTFQCLMVNVRAVREVA